jgi:hypothetical protein
MGFGSQPYGSSPYGAPPAEQPGEHPVPLITSRLIDARGRYVIDDEGAFAAMDDVAQRVLLLIAFRAGPKPKIIDDRAISARQAQIRAALQILTKGPSPVIEIKEIIVERSAPGKLKESVKYRRLVTNTIETAEAR